MSKWKYRVTMCLMLRRGEGTGDSNLTFKGKDVLFHLSKLLTLQCLERSSKEKQRRPRRRRYQHNEKHG